MKFVASKKTLLDALNKVVGVTDKKSAMPMLANVLITAGDVVMLAASDLYQSVSCQVDVTPQERGSVAIHAKDLLDRVKMLPDGDVQVSVGDGLSASIKAVGSSRSFTLAGLPGSEFPQLPKCAPTAPKLSWTAGDLRSLISRVHFAISTDETRAHINSMLLEATSDTLRLVATDGHRLALAEMPWSHAANVSILVPLKAVTELKKLLAKDGLAETVDLRVSGAVAFFDVAGVEFSTKLVEAQFPPYQQVVPAKSPRKAVVSRSDIINAVKAVSVAANSKTGGIKVEFADGKARLSAQHEANGGTDELAADYEASPGHFGINAKYFLDAAGAFEEDELNVAFDTELDPIVITAGKGAKSVVMPMRI
ncbi:DNA polymerase III subunit beta [Sorangium sp. So ce118]